MKVKKEKIWTWFLPEQPGEIGPDWVKNGGKWIVFDTRERILALAESLQPWIDAGDVVAAKSWNGDPSALNIYSLDRYRTKTKLLLDHLGAAGSRVWEYDYALGKNILEPFAFMYSWSMKCITILRSYGMRGTVNLVRELLSPGNAGP